MDDVTSSSPLSRVRLGRTDCLVARLALSTRRLAADSPHAADLATRTIDSAIDAGINLIDIPPSPDTPQIESLLGQLASFRSRRNQLLLATGIPLARLTGIHAAVEASLQRLGVDRLDLLQLHAPAFSDTDIRTILHDGPLHTLEALRARGSIRFIGLCVEDPASARPLIASFRFDTFQLRYNILDQASAQLVLNEARRMDLGIIAAHPLSSGRFQHICERLAPNLPQAHDLYDLALRFVLSDARIHAACVSMSSPDQVIRNAALTSLFHPPLDLAQELRP